MALSRIDLHFVKLARMQGERSSFSHSKKGAVIAKENKILSTGVSSHLNEGRAVAAQAGGENEQYVATIGAELVAISAAVRSNISLNGSTIYLSAEPNWIAFKIIVTMGIKRIAFYGPLTSDRIRHYATELGVEILSVG